MTGISVNTQALDSAAAKVEDIAAEYKKDYEALYADIEQLRNSWDGEDNVAYTAKINGYRDDYDYMYNTMVKYANYLREAAQQYRTTQDNIAQNTSRLSTGK